MTIEQTIEFLSDQLREHIMMYTLRNTYANTLQMFKEYDKITNSYKEVIKLLEDMKPKLLTLEEADKVPYVWLESKNDVLGVRRIRIVHVGSTAISVQAFGKLDTMVAIYEFEKHFRCWDKEPTDEQRQNTPWKE